MVAIPTETVYGLAADYSNASAVAKIFATKERPTFDPLIVHLCLECRTSDHLAEFGLIQRSQVSKKLAAEVNQLIQHFWPGPLTLVLPKHPSIPDLITGGLPTVALRMPNHPYAQAIIAASKTCLAAPSANRFGRISPTSAEAVEAELGEKIEWILDGGPSRIGIESTVLGFDEQDHPWILRHGGTSKEDLEDKLQTSIQIYGSSLPTHDRTPQASPGLSLSHYAPGKPLYLAPKPLSQWNHGDFCQFLEAVAPNFQNPPLKKNLKSVSLALLLQSGLPEPVAARFAQWTLGPVVARSLSQTADLSEAARSLFAELRFLDSSDAALILAEPCSIQSGLGYAISDRLVRASHRK